MTGRMRNMVSDVMNLTKLFVKPISRGGMKITKVRWVFPPTSRAVSREIDA